MLNMTSIVPTDARNGGPNLSSSRPSSIEKYQESPMLISPPAEDPEHVDTAPHCQGVSQLLQLLLIASVVHHCSVPTA